VIVEVSAQTAPDAFLYYRRTHGGAWPPPGVDPSDQAGETTNCMSSVAVVAPPSKPGISSPQRKNLCDNGVDPAALGKGDWIWQMPTCTNRLGGYIPAVTNVQSLMDWEKNHGMDWIAVKCGNGGIIWSQFDTSLVTLAHAVGLKIFGWAYSYGSDVPGEINVAINALNLGADGFIIDAESEYEVLPNNDAAAAQYCQGIRAAYPTRFLAHAPFPIISSHPGFPYKTFGTNCDAVMPQAYWIDVGGTAYAASMVSRMNTEWFVWQNSLTGVFTNAIKPIAPIGGVYNSVNGAVDASQIATFMFALNTITPPATAGGYKGVSYWSAQHHGESPDKWPALAAAAIGTNSFPPYLPYPLVDRVADAGTPLLLSALVDGAAPLSYQWYANGALISGATDGVYAVPCLQATDAGAYCVVVSNVCGAATSRVASVTVYPPHTVVFEDNFDTDTTANWIANRSSADTRITFNYNYAVDGIPPAPHSTGGTTRGVKFEANLAAGALAALSISPVGQRFGGDYRLHFDMWINVNGPFPGGGRGSTEFLTAGLGTAGNRVEWTGSGSIADGVYFSVDGEGGVSDASTTSGDYCAYLGAALLGPGSGVYSAGTAASARANGHLYYIGGFGGGLSAPSLQQFNYPQQVGTLLPGTVGFAWHDVLIAKRGTTVEWSMDGVRLATVPSVSLTASNVFIGYWDPFTSISDKAALSFGLADNVRVEIPAVAPSIAAQPLDSTVPRGADATFSVTASGVPAPAYQWKFNGADITGASASAYTKSNVQPADAGSYSVLVTNVAGAVTSSDALLSLIPAQPARFELVHFDADHSVHLVISGEPGATCSIETSTNLFDWAPLASTILTNGVVDFTDASATEPERFYRATLAP